MKAGVVPWYGLTWKELNERGFMPQLEKHLIELAELRGSEAADGYLQYLKGETVNGSAGSVERIKQRYGIE